jgi:hypothetical protein
LGQAINLGLLDINPEGVLLITEGHDEPFIKTMAERFRISTKHVQFLNIGTQARSLSAVVTALSALCPELEVRIIHDYDFCLLDPEERLMSEKIKIGGGKCNCPV